MAETEGTPANTAERGSKSPNSPAATAGAAAPAPEQSPEQSSDAPIEAEDTAPDDSDAGYGSDDASTTASTSISSSVRDYAFENSHRYHKFQEGRYHFPNDEVEQAREDMKHAMTVNVCRGRLHFSPLRNIGTVLDIGTGIGAWAIDMGDEYPQADVLGIDLSPIQPPWVPPNVRFMVDDAEADWMQGPDSLDFVHSRFMTSSIRDWPRLVSQAYTALKPGAWIELQELRFILECDDETVRDDNQVAAFFGNIKAGLAAFGIDLLAMERNKALLRAAGFVNVEERVIKVPLGAWPKDPTMKTIGMYNRNMIYDGLHGLAMGPFTRGLKWSPESVEVFLVGVRKALMDSSQHGYVPFHVVMGQKPE